MSQENVEAFKRAIEAFNRSGNFDMVLEEVHPEVEWHAGMTASLVGEAAAVHRGREGAREMTEELRQAFTDIHFEISEIRDLGDRLLALGRIHARGAESRVEAAGLSG